MAETEWYLGLDGQQSGPHDEATLEAFAEQGRLTPQTYVWRKGMSDWAFAGQTPLAARLFPTAPPEGETALSPGSPPERAAPDPILPEGVVPEPPAQTASVPEPSAPEPAAAQSAPPWGTEPAAGAPEPPAHVPRTGGARWGRAISSVPSSIAPGDGGSPTGRDVDGGGPPEPGSDPSSGPTSADDDSLAPLNDAPFGTAVSRYLGWYVRFSGRASRSEFWWAMLFVFLVGIGLGVVEGFAFGFYEDAPAPLSGLFTLATFLPSLSVSVRRLHDIDRTGWWVLIGLFPLVGLIILIVFWIQKGTGEHNRFGPTGLADPAATDASD